MALVALLASAVAAPAANAVTIDFEEFANGAQGTGAFVYPEATFTSSTGNIFVNGAGASKDFCAFNGFSCFGTLTVDFTAPVSNLTFGTAGENSAGILSSAGVYINGILATSVAISYDGSGVTYDLVDLTAFANITRLVLTSTESDGVTWDNFSFDVVPEPSTAALLALGLVGLAAVRRRS